LNFSENSPEFNIPENITFSTSELLISNYPVDASDDIHKTTLRPYESRVYRLNPS
jgi:oligo-1,6-glucosidase